MITSATSTMVSSARTRCAVAITLAGLRRSTSAPAGMATSSHGSVEATATAATAAADESTETASSGSAMTRSPSPVSEPAQASTNRWKDAGSAAAVDVGEIRPRTVFSCWSRPRSSLP